MGLKSQVVEVALAAAIACTGTAIGGLTPQSVAAQAVQPDIINITLDDLASPAHGRIFNRQREIRQLFVRNGVEVTRMYSETPLCSPGRAGLLTGQHTYNHGVTSNSRGHKLPHSETINFALKREGYQTHLIGKNVKGSGKKPPGWTKIAIMGGTKPTRFTINGKLRYFGNRWKDTVVKSQALKWLDATRNDTPVFQWVSFVAPHTQRFSKTTGRSYVPFVMKRDRGAWQCRNIGKFKPPTYTTRTNPREAYPMPSGWRTGWRLQKYCESILNVDRYIGQLIKLLKERGRPWVVIMSADNGMSWGVNGFSQKRTYPASRIPIYVASSGMGIRKGASLPALLSSIDIAPTIADVAGINFPTADGISFLAGLKGEAFSGRSEVLQVMPTDNTQRYMAWFGLIKRDGSWLVRWANGRKELYRWKKDPWFSNNLASNRPALRNQLNTRLSVTISQSRN